MGMEALPKSENEQERCQACGGEVQGWPLGEMYAGAFVAHGRRVEIRRSPRAGFRNPIRLDSLTQYFDGGLYRLFPSDRYFARGGKRIHRAVWTAAFGRIPEGCHIHHMDSDPANNDIRNLECLPRLEHLAKTRHSGPVSQKARLAAAKWHGSEEGRLWHRRNMARVKTWTKWKREQRPCGYCGKSFSAVVRRNGLSAKWCSEVCKSANWRESHPGYGNRRRVGHHSSRS